MTASLWTNLVLDAQQLTQMATGQTDLKSTLKVVLSYDSFQITTLNRLRQLVRKMPLPGMNHLLRSLQTIVHGIEIGKHVTLGQGVWFIHPLGIVIGGDTKVGDRVRFFGNNTLGQAKEDGYPTIEDDVWIGAGARILGPITIGARSRIGANAVVLSSIPPDSVAVGMPARIVSKNPISEGKNL